MSHVHNIQDTDKNFIINTITRNITTDSDKLTLVQYDHNSERFMFEVPRYIEEHDMSESTRIEIHFSNYTRTKKEHNEDVYVVDNVMASREKVYFSWLISSNATKLVGFLSFSVTFICHNNSNEVTYTWSTAMFDGITVAQRYNNTETVVEAYPDLYEQMKQEILNSGGGNTGNGGNDSGGGSSGGVIDNVIEFDDVKPSEDEFDNTVEF